MHNPGVMRCGNAKLYLNVIARSEATKQSILTFFAARWIASLTLAMTTEMSWLFEN
jgi:hypothetical protein